MHHSRTICDQCLSLSSRHVDCHGLNALRQSMSRDISTENIDLAMVRFSDPPLWSSIQFIVLLRVAPIAFDTFLFVLTFVKFVETGGRFWSSRDGVKGAIIKVSDVFPLSQQSLFFLV